MIDRKWPKTVFRLPVAKQQRALSKRSRWSPGSARGLECAPSCRSTSRPDAFPPFVEVRQVKVGLDVFPDPAFYVRLFELICSHEVRNFLLRLPDKSVQFFFRQFVDGFLYVFFQFFCYIYASYGKNCLQKPN